MQVSVLFALFFFSLSFGLPVDNVGTTVTSSVSDSALEECAICYNPLGDEDEVVPYQCDTHTFHKECAIRWHRAQSLSSKCPMCRKDPKRTIGDILGIEVYSAPPYIRPTPTNVVVPPILAPQGGFMGF
jgi:hypothetical protein